jgi:hypothetical protein
VAQSRRLVQDGSGAVLDVVVFVVVNDNDLLRSWTQRNVMIHVVFRIDSIFGIGREKGEDELDL